MNKKEMKERKTLFGETKKISKAETVKIEGFREEMINAIMGNKEQAEEGLRLGFKEAFDEAYVDCKIYLKNHGSFNLNPFRQGFPVTIARCYSHSHITHLKSFSIF